MKVTLLLLSGSLAAAQLAPAAPAGCKLLPGDANWPADTVWKQALPEVVARGPQENITRPDYRIDAESSADVIAAVKFASQHNVRLSILNSGHDFLGRADAPSGLALSVGMLKGIRALPSFTPSAQGAQSAAGATANVIKPAAGTQAAVTIGAGVTTQELNDALEGSGLFTMGAAHVLEYKVVTADGQLRVANAVTNSDLFWALRGGGGGTFGVVVEATIKAFPSPKVSLIAFFLNTTDYNDHKSIYPTLAYMHQEFKQLNEKGNSGYYFMFNNAVKGTFINGDDGVTPASLNETWQPVLQRMANMPGMNPKTLVVSTKEFSNFKQFYDGAFGSAAGHDHGATEETGGHDHASEPTEATGGHDHASEPTEAAGGHDHAAEPTEPAGGHDHGTETAGTTEPSTPAAGGHEHGAETAGTETAGGHDHDLGSIPSAAPTSAPLEWVGTGLSGSSSTGLADPSGLLPVGGAPVGGASPPSAPSTPSTGSSTTPASPGTGAGSGLSGLFSGSGGLSSLFGSGSSGGGLSSLFSGLFGGQGGTSKSKKSDIPEVEARELDMDLSPGFLKNLLRRHGDEAMSNAMGIIPLDSRLLGEKELSSPQLAEALEKSMPDMVAGQIRGHLIGGGKVLTQGQDTSVLPAWRKSYVHLIGTGVGFPDVSGLKALDPTMGAYSNEASIKEPNWKQTFWGSNYNRLSEVKTKYDPNQVFWVTPGINADQMVVNNGRLCKATGPSTNSRVPPENDNKNYGGQSSGDDSGDGSPFPLLYQGA
ncbi:hypothetical protein P152DRAFT_480166 [Eremomyces bilateralis CBS 781.70]|uniref:FAD-binding PCMH-type domain-containing protein n=1 Tax=Eremomyces bilateralis CBS 781.70 TaxID=1392243 RepID=A0A6G1GB52_9PEZI|nr:uncharacterized protein P152DRAFT_480166 [Eremomyces bilateralis CBS 781.70]KAF1815079.1 hypothetical protein P152DRAFT_480166 [Eremomyces bilateralis CBS 781.70]